MTLICTTSSCSSSSSFTSMETPPSCDTIHTQSIPTWEDDSVHVDDGSSSSNCSETCRCTASISCCGSISSRKSTRRGGTQTSCCCCCTIIIGGIFGRIVAVSVDDDISIRGVPRTERERDGHCETASNAVNSRSRMQWQSTCHQTKPSASTRR